MEVFIFRKSGSKCQYASAVRNKRHLTCALLFFFSILLFGASQAHAVCNTTGTPCLFNQTVSTGFDTAITLTKNADINFGTVGLAACTYRISTAAAVSVVLGGSSCGYITGTKSAASITIQGSGTEIIGVSITGETADRTVSIAAGTETCAYNGGSSGSCTINGAAAPTSTGLTLLIGVDVTASGNEAVNTTYSPSFTVNVIYQ